MGIALDVPEDGLEDMSDSFAFSACQEIESKIEQMRITLNSCMVQKKYSQSHVEEKANISLMNLEIINRCSESSYKSFYVRKKEYKMIFNNHTRLYKVAFKSNDSKKIFIEEVNDKNCLTFPANKRILKLSQHIFEFLKK